nr:hypothetical protein [Tanacetum cinerariifolium]
MIKVLPPKTAKEVVARERERKVRTTLLMALPEDHLEKFHKMADTKEMWEAIKSKFGGNDESKKMRKYLLKQQFEGCYMSTSEGLHKGYDRFQTLLSQLEIHGDGVSHEDANQKFLRSLPSFWSQVALIMRTKPGLDTLTFDDLYNNLRVFERDVKGTTPSSSNTQNVAFVSADNTSSTTNVSIAYSVSSPSVSKSQKEGSSSYTDEVIHSFFANQSSAPQLDYDDLEQINDDDMEEMDLKWQVAMISMRIKKFHKRTGRKLQFDTKDPVGFDKTKVKCFNCHKMGRPAYQDDSKALVTIDEEDIDWSGHVEEDAQNYAMMAYSSSNSGSNNETSVDVSDSKTSEYASCESDSSVEITTSMPAPVENALKVVCEPKVWTDAPIIKEYESDSDDDSVSNVQEDKEKPSFAFTDSIQYVKPSRHMTENKAHLADYQEFKGGSVTFGGSNGRITGKGKIKAGRLDFENVYYVEELKHLLLKIPRQHNMYSFNLKNINPSEDLACLFAKASIDESNKWHRRLGHVNFKNLNKLMKGNLVRGLPSKIFENDHTCVACQKGKQHKASCKVKSDETTPILKDFIRQAENQFNHKVKTIRSDNGTEFKNHELIKFCRLKGIKREYSNVKTSQQNRVAERKNKTFIEAARTMLADSFLPTTFWAEADNTACYVLNRVTILNTIDQLGKFDGKSDLGFLVGYSLNNKAFMVYNLESKRVKENLHVNFQKNKPNIVGKGHAWMFDLNYLTNSMNYEPVLVENQANKFAGPKEANNNAGTQANDDQDANSKEIDLHEEHFVLPIWSAYSTSIKNSGDKLEKNTNFKTYLPFGKKAIRTRWVYRNKKDERGVIVKNKARLVAQEHSVKTASTPIETQKPLVKDEEAADVKELASPKQTALGKDNSNPLIVDSLLKTIWLSMHHVIAMKHWLFQSKRLLIVYFLNGQVIQYALMVNPTIYVSCIKQLWATVSIKKVNDMVKLRALIDGKRVVITEDVIRQDLCLDDADGVECLPNVEIFTKLARMGYEKPPPKLTFYKAFFSGQWKFLIHTLVQCVSAKRAVWNEFSCSMASTVICLAIGRKFNFSKYIFDSMVRNVDSLNKFLMYLQFLQVIINAQVDDISSHTNQYTSPALTPKVFANMRRVGGCIQTGERIEAIDAYKDITLVDAKTQVNLGAKLQGRKYDDNAAIKDASVVEPTVFDDDEVTMTMAQTLIKMKAEKEKDDLEKAKVLQQQYVDKQENIDWNVVGEQMQEKHLDNIRKYQNLKRKPISIAQAWKNMIINLKNMVRYKMEHFRGMTYDKESFKKLKAVEVSGSHSTQDNPTHDPKEMSEEDVQNMLEIVSVSEFKVEALQVKEDLDALWRLVKEKFCTVVPTVDKEKVLWVELKRLFEPDADDVIWKLQRYMHYPLLWKLHSNCRVHQVSFTIRRHGMFMLIEQDYPLSNGVMTLMLSTKLQVEEDSEMARDLVMRIFMKANQPKSRTGVSHIVGFNLSKLAIILNWLKKIHSKRLTHSTFHVSNLKKCLAKGDIVVLIDEIQLDDKLHMIEEPVEVVDREVKRLKQTRIPIVKFRWNSQRGPEFTWECEDHIKEKYPHLFTSKDEAIKADKSS